MAHGTGSSAYQDLSRVALHADNIRQVDKAAGINPRVDRDDGCSHVQDLVECEGPPDWKYQGKYYCVDHIDDYLCCGSKLSPEQRERILADPMRARWIEDTANAKMLAAQMEREAWDAQTFEIIGNLDFDPDDEAPAGFSWQEHQKRLNDENRLRQVQSTKANKARRNK